jgi:hypothetical protein
MADIFEENYRCYGYRLHAMLFAVTTGLFLKRLSADADGRRQLVVGARRRRYNSYGENQVGTGKFLARDFSFLQNANEKWLRPILRASSFRLQKVYLSPLSTALMARL